MVPGPAVGRWSAPPVALCLAYALLTAAWLIGNPTGASPDEPAHYFKAISVGRGQLVSRPATGLPVSSDSPQEEAWLERTTRAVDVPAGLWYGDLACNAFQPLRSAECQHHLIPYDQPSVQPTNFGTAQPTTYLLPGLLVRLADNPVSAVRLARVGNAVACLALLVLAVAALWQGPSGGWALAGLIVAVTPMVVFLAATLNSSGPEVAGAVCFFAAWLRLTRGSSPAVWPWAVAAVSGAVLASSRSLGPLFVVLLMVIAATTIGRGATWQLVRTGGRRAWLSLGAVAVAMGLGIGWELAVQPDRPGGVAARRALQLSWQELPFVLRQQVGFFGFFDAPMPRIGYLAWTALLIALFALAMWAGTNRQRLILGLLVPATLVLTVLVAVMNRMSTGFGMQGRYILPFTVALPLLAGETLYRNRQRLQPLRRAPVLTCLATVAAAVQAGSWHANARRHAVGLDGSWLFFLDSEWHPGGGWYPVMAASALGAVLMTLFALLSPARDEPVSSGGACRARRTRR